MEQNSDYKEHELIDELDEDLDNIHINDDYITRRKFASKSKFQEQPLIWGGIGIALLLSIIALLFGNRDSSINKELVSVNERLDRIEQRIATIESTPQDETSLKDQLEANQKSLSELEQSVNSLAAYSNDLGKKVTRVEKDLVSAKSPIKSQTKKTAQPRTAVKISKYTVMSGDTLYSISKKYGTTVDELLRINNLTSDKEIFPGQELVVPTIR